jgi:UMF1 family MFS transporter
MPRAYAAVDEGPPTAGIGAPAPRAYAAVDEGPPTAGIGAPAPRAYAAVDDAQSDETTPRELRAFYLIDVANSVYSTVGIGGFLPLLIQSAAQASAGFPAACANVFTNATAAEWPFLPAPAPGDFFFRVAGAGGARGGCGGGAPACFNGVCAGLPATLGECRDVAGGAEAALRTRGALAVDPTAFATLAITASVVLQAAAFLLLGPLADRGGARKRILLAASAVGAAACAGALLVTPATFWVGLPVAIITNVAFGVSGVMMNAFLPLLAAALPEVRAAPPAARGALEAARAADISSRGFAAGYAAGVAGILLCVPLVAALPELDAYRAALCVTGAWWGLFMIPVARWLRARPGPPMPAGATALSEAARSLAATLHDLRGLPGTRTYLLLWALFSDGVFLVGTIGGLYAASRVEWPCSLPKAAGVLLVFLLCPLFAAAFNIFYMKLAARLAAPPERMLVAMLVIIGATVPAAGFAGIKTGPQIIAVACVWAAHMGAMQASSRAVFASLVPRGKEAAFFSLYELTNRGSSFVGPLVLTTSLAATGGYAWAFSYVCLACFGGAAGVFLLDVPAAQAAARAAAGAEAAPAAAASAEAAPAAAA